MSQLSEALHNVSSHPQFWLWIGMAIAAGILLGLTFILVVVIRRRKQNINSLIALEDCIGFSSYRRSPLRSN